MITLNVLDALAKINPALEEAAQSVGARGWTVLRTITLPLTTPGYIAGALLVFIWTFSDFATPLVLGVHDLLASQAYLNIVQFVDRRLFRMGIVISALMVVLAVVFLVAARRRHQGLLVALVLEGRAPAALAARPDRRRRVSVGPDARLLHSVPRRVFGIGWEGLVADADSGAVHPGLFRARDRRDAEVHREQLSLFGTGRRAVRRDRRADRVGPRAHPVARTRHARLSQHADPRDPGDRDRHRVHPRVPLRPAG